MTCHTDAEHTATFLEVWNYRLDMEEEEQQARVTIAKAKQ